MHSICGQPAAAQQRVVRRSVQQRIAVPCPEGSRRRSCFTVVEEVVDVLVDEWTYDFGPNRFIEHLTFEQGRLVDVVSGGYGHRD